MSETLAVFSPATVRKLRNVFDELDLDKSGEIDEREVTSAFQSLGISVSKAKARAVLDQADINRTGTIEWEDFLVLHKTFIMEVFNLLDVNSDGSIDPVELHHGLRKLGGVPEVEVVQLMMEDLDIGKSGGLTLDEFLGVYDLLVQNPSFNFLDPTAASLAQAWYEQAPKRWFEGKRVGSLEGAIDFFSGTMAGMVGKVVEYPFDTIKVRMQIDPTEGSLSVARRILQQEGWRGFFAGLMAPVAGAMAENAVCFYGFGQAKKALQWYHGTSSLSHLDLFAAGAAAGAAVSFVLTPVELVKCRMQTMAGTQYTGVWDCTRRVIRKEGFRGLYRGNTATMAREIPGNGITYMSYEVMCEVAAKHMGCHHEELPTYVYACAGGVAGMLYWPLPYPMDTVKSRMQTSSSPKPFFTTLRDIVRHHGIRGLYRGFPVTILRSAPASATVFVTYEAIKKATTLYMER